ncbi:MAG: zinc-ribbon domain-containing protein [Solirubrobacteraceae bacterium]
MVRGLVDEFRRPERAAEDRLTQRKAEILGKLHLGDSTAEIAKALAISPVTARRDISDLGEEGWRTRPRRSNQQRGRVWFGEIARDRSIPLAGTPRVLASWRSLSIKRPDLAAQFHRTLNGTLDPATIGAGSSQPVWWCCEACGHGGRDSPMHRSREGRGCPLCRSRPHWRLHKQCRASVRLRSGTPLCAQSCTRR